MGVQLCQPSGAFGACTCDSEAADGGSLGANEIAGEVALFDKTGASGIFVALTNSVTTLSTYSDAGEYQIDGVPSAEYVLSFSEDVPLPPDTGWVSSDGGTFVLHFADDIPEVLSMPGSDGLVLDGSGSLFSLSPFEVFPARRLGWSEDPSWVLSDGGTYVGLLTSFDSMTELGTLQVGAATGDAPMVTLGTGVSNGFGFSPDGRSVGFLVSSPGLTNALTVASSDGTGAATQLASGVGGFLFSPDSSHLAFLEGFKSDAGTGALQVAQSSGDGGSINVAADVFEYGFSPNSAFLAALSDRTLGTEVGTLYVWSAGAGAVIQVGAQAYTPQFAPDNSRLAFISGQPPNLVTVSPDGTGTPKQLATNVVGFQFSQDGAYIVYWTNAPSLNILFVTPADGSTSPTQLATDATVPVLFSPDGQWIAFTGYSDPANYTLAVESVASPGTPAQLAYGLNQIYSFQFSPDSLHIAFQAATLASLEDQIGVSDPDGSNWNTFGAGCGAYYQFSADSSQIAFLNNVNNAPTGMLSTISSDGSGTPIQIAAGVSNANPYQFEYSADGRYLGYLTNYSGNTGSAYVARSDASTAPTALATSVVASSSRSPWPLEFSPDGSRAAFIRADGALTIGSSTGSAQNIELFDDAVNFGWVGQQSLLGFRAPAATVPPYEFQDGLYTFVTPTVAP